jgi:hypothetical protein
MKQGRRRLCPSGLQRVTPCPPVLRWKDLASSRRIKLPGRGSNPRLPINGRTSCLSTTWHRCTATGNRTPLPGLRARCLGLWTIAASAGAGRLERPKACTSTCFRDRLLIRPDHSHCLRPGALGGVRAHGLVPTKEVLYSAELQGQVSRRHDSNVRPPPSDSGALGPSELRRGGVDGRGRTCTLQFRRPAP